MYRLAYLIPRFILLALVCAGAAIAGDSLTKSALTAHLESATGMDIELGRLRTRLAKGKVFVSDLALVDPAKPLNNIFQADLAYFELDQTALSRRQLVVENARASQVRFGVPRTSPVRNPLPPNISSPALLIPNAELRAQQTGDSPSSLGRFEHRGDQIRMAWMDQFESQGLAGADTTQPTPIKLYQLASTTNENWNRNFQQHHGRLKAVTASFAKVSNSADGQLSMDEVERHGLNGPPNPLRGASDNREQASELAEILQTLERLQQQQAALEEKAAADSAMLDSTWQNDSGALDAGNVSMASEVSPETLSQLLLTDLHQRIANDAMEWFQGVRENVSSCAGTQVANAVPCPGRGRGAFVPIPGTALERPTIIKKLTFDGAGRFNQQHVNFAGEAFEISDQPTKHSLPVTFSLRAQGDQHFALRGSIDRRLGVCQDSLTVNFPAFHLGPQRLGTENEMLVTTGAGTTAHGAIQLKIDGQNVSGSMRLDFSNIALVFEHLHDVAGGKEIALRLNQSLATLQRFESSATFSGTLSSPRLEFESSLGQEVAAAIAEINKGQTEHQHVAVKQQVDQFYQSQVVSLKTNISSELDSMSRLINAQIERATKMRASLMTAKTRWPEMR